MENSRATALSEIANHITSLNLGHPVRVGIDGITASGKSTFAQELAEQIRRNGRNVIMTTLDGFHNPRVRRYERGRRSPDGYYFDAYNYNEVIEQLLVPLASHGTMFYKTHVFDLNEDQPIDLPAQHAEVDSILIVDGSFALRKELAPYWDVSIYLLVDFNTAENRASIRDANAFGSEEAARIVTRERYHGAHRIHLEQAQPIATATFVVNNSDPSAATILMPQSRVNNN